MQKGWGNLFISEAILLGFFVIVACIGWMIGRDIIHTNNIQEEENEETEQCG